MLKQIFSPHRQRPPIGGVRQDKGLVKSQRVASSWPGPVKTSFQRLPFEQNSRLNRSQNVATQKLVKVKASTWLSPFVRQELKRLADGSGMSLSGVMAIALEQWVEQDLQSQHEALLYPVIRRVIREELQAFGNRIVYFLIHIAFSVEQARILVTNVLDRVIAGKPEILFKLVDQSQKTARRNVLDKSQVIKSLLEEYEKQALEKTTGEGERNGK